MPNREKANHLLEAANRNFKALTGMSDVTIFSDEVYGFHAQQAVEKCAKAWLELLDCSYPRSHNLIALFVLLEKARRNVEPFWHLAELNSFVVQYRYESFYASQEGVDRDSIVNDVGKFLDHVRELV